MRRTYRSKKETGGGVDHRDMVLSVDSKSSLFDAYYIQNIKQVKREISCVSSSNPYTSASYKVRRRKYVKRLKEPEPLRKSLSESAYLTPDKSIHVNRIPDLFDQLLDSSTNALTPKTTAKSNINVQDFVQPRLAKKTYRRKNIPKGKKLNQSSSDSTDSDKENSLSDESYSQNTSNVKAHKLIIERERVFSPIHLDDSINKIAEKFPFLNKLRRESTKGSTDGRGRFNNIPINVTQSPLLQSSPQCSTPFHDKYRGKSIYNFSPIKTNSMEAIKLIDKNIYNNNIVSSFHINSNSRSDDNILESITNINTNAESSKINTVNNIVENEKTDEYQITSKGYLTNETTSLSTTELEPFLGFSVNCSFRNSEDDFYNYKKNGTALSNNGFAVEGISDNQVLSEQSIQQSIENINCSIVSSIQSHNETDIYVKDLKNKTAASESEFVESESLYDTCDSENITDYSSRELKPKELRVTIDRLSDSVFQKYYKRMVDPSLTNDNTSSISNSISDEINDSINNTIECEVNQYDSFKDLDIQGDISHNSSNNNIHNDKHRFDSENLELNDIQITSSSENENSDSKDIEEEDICLSFVTTRRRNDVTNDSFLLNLDNSYNSTSTTSLDKTVHTCNRERLDETELIDNTLVNKSAEDNVSFTKVKAQTLTDMQLLSTENEYTESLELVKSISDEEVIINTSKSSKLFRESLCPADETVNGLRQGIILKPGKKWERSLSIYKRMTTMGDTFDHSILDGEAMKSKGRKYRQSVISTMEMQNTENQGSLHNESVFNRRSTFVSKPRRSAIKIFKDPNASNITLSSSVLYDDLEGFLNGDCDDTIIELSKLSISDSGHEVTVLDKFHDTSNRIVTSRDYVLRRCNQTAPVLFDECYPDTVLKNCRKIGEGVYGEVFLWRAGDGRARVMKIVPIAGTTRVNGEEQKDYHEIISEIVIAMELSALRAPIPEIERQLDDGKEIDALDLQSVQNATDVFNEVLAVRCVYGAYPSRLLDLWELYDECKGSENDNPAALPADQQYIVLELANAGQDLESYQFNNAEQACALFKQIALGLAAAEEAFQFEHRDLHWGNVLIAPTDQKYATFVIRGRLHRTPRCGVAATLIDYSLSRAARDGRALYNDLAEDEALFDAVGDYQFEVYRLMRDKLGNDWKNFEPYTNILWLHYTVDKMITALRYTRTNTKIHKHYIAKLKEIKNRVLHYGSATQFILTDNEF